MCYQRIVSSAHEASQWAPVSARTAAEQRARQARAAHLARLRAAQEARRRRRRVALTVITLTTLGALTAAGFGVGAAAGAAAQTIRARWPAADPPLPATKIAPPPPVDISGPAVACTAAALQVVAAPSSSTIKPGEPINVVITVTHVGRHPCLANGGLQNMRLRLVSDDGAAAGWSSPDCGFNGDRALLMGPGHSFEWAVTLDGRASAANRCTEGQPDLAPGAWNLIASLGEVAHSDSAPVPMRVPAPVPQVGARSAEID